MRLRMPRLLRELSGRANTDMVGLLVDQIDVTLEGARLARDAALGGTASDTARDAMGGIEHAGDEARGQLVSVLAHALVTPIDREDLFRVSRSIDDVLDNLRDFVREMDLLDAPDELFAPVIDEVIDALGELREAVDRLVTDPADVQERALAAKKACNRIRRVYQEQMANLLRGEVTASMLRRRELLRRLDVVGLRLGEAVDALTDGAMKRGG